MVTTEIVKNHIWKLREEYYDKVQDLFKKISNSGDFTEEEILELQDYV